VLALLNKKFAYFIEYFKNFLSFLKFPKDTTLILELPTPMLMCSLFFKVLIFDLTTEIGTYVLILTFILLYKLTKFLTPSFIEFEFLFYTEV